MQKNPLEDLPPVFLSSTALSDRVHAGVKRGEFRKIGPRLYTANLRDDPEVIARKNCWLIASYLFPGAVAAHRTAFEVAPTPDGFLYLTAPQATRTTKVSGLTLRLVHGPGPLPGDTPFVENLWLASRPRAFLENLQPARIRGGATRALSRAHIEDRLARMIRIDGPEVLNRLRDQARELAPALEAEQEFAILEDLIGTLLGTRETSLTGVAAIARAAVRPYDADRLPLFEALAGVLRDAPVPTRPNAKANDTLVANHLAFIDAYFSNYIEGTEFEVHEAAEIVFAGKRPENRPKDTHDILGTYAILHDPVQMRESALSLANNVDEVISLIRRRHATLMGGRPEVGPGEFKKVANRAGLTTFVAPELVIGTLERGIEFFRTLDRPFARAAFMMFLIAEVHPFVDGNGRTARVMMNAELASAGEMSILIPTVYRDNYLAGLRAMSRNAQPQPFIQVLDFAQRFASELDYQSLPQLFAMLEVCNAFRDSDEARLLLPSSTIVRNRLPLAT